MGAGSNGLQYPNGRGYDKHLQVACFLVGLVEMGLSHGLAPSPDWGYGSDTSNLCHVGL